MKTAIIVQARMGSSRLPGKVVQEAGGKTILQEVLTRCQAVPGADSVVCAVPDESPSDELEKIAIAAGADLFRGSEHDVLSRYLGAAKSVNADIIMRVTSDCPLIDPQICGAVLKLRQDEDADYAANNIERTFPHGLDCEAFTRESLELADANAEEIYDREHVTPWIRKAVRFKRVNLVAADRLHIHERWTLDYPDDLKFIRAVLGAKPSGTDMQSTLAILDANPGFRAINAHHRTATRSAEAVQ